MTLASRILARRMRLVRPRSLHILHERDLRVPMEDGAALLADRYVEHATAGEPQPTVLVRSPYGRRGFVGLMFGRLLAERGLQVVVQSVRGTFGSEGTLSPFDERADGLATLRWLRAQPWHAGPIGMIGPSYLGLVQWAVAADAGEDLRALSIQVSASQFYEQTYGGGSLSLETIGSWMAVIASQESRLGLLAIRIGVRRLRRVLSELPLGELDERGVGRPVEWFREAFAHTARQDPYWAARDFSSRVPEVGAEVQMIGGFHDILLPWMLEDYAALRRAGRSPQLQIGSWSHTSPGLAAAGHRDGIAWLRAHLLDDRRLVRRERVRVFVTGERRGWRELSDWPPPEATEQRLHLAGGGGLGGTVPAPTGVDEYRYDPADPTPSVGGPVLLDTRAVLDNRELESRPDVLTYTSPALEAPWEAIGEVTVELWARCDSEHFDLFARVCDVEPGGASLNVCDALARVAPGRYEQAADESWRVAFSLWPMAHRFAAGHRIRLQVSSGAHPRYARNPGTGEDPLRAVELRAVRVAILSGGEHPSALKLPRIS